jgi:hypothetical protein
VEAQVTPHLSKAQAEELANRLSKSKGHDHHCACEHCLPHKRFDHLKYKQRGLKKKN